MSQGDYRRRVGSVVADSQGYHLKNESDRNWMVTDQPNTSQRVVAKRASLILKKDQAIGFGGHVTAEIK